jgi:O-antigen/teichoic acid export membrane protein
MADPAPTLEYTPAPPASRLGGLLAAIARRGGWAITDQAVASIGNFGRDALLAHYLGRSDYGTYGMMMQALLFLSSLQAALVIYPVQVRGATEDEAHLPRFITASALLTLALSLPLLIAMGISSIYAAYGTLLAPAATSAAMMGFLLVFQFQELSRRTLMARLRFGAAVPGDAVAYLGQLGLLVAMGHLGWLGGPYGVARGLAAISVLTVIAALMQAWLVGFAPVALADFRNAARDFWQLGKWVAAANFTMLFTDIGYNWLLGKVHAPDIAGEYRVITYLNKLANPVVMTLGGIIVPVVARTKAGSSMQFAKRVGLKYAAVGFVAIAGYMLLLLLFPRLVLGIFFDKYLHVANGVRIFALTGLVGYAATMAIAILNGLGRPQVQFWTQVANTAATLVVGLPLTIAFGLYGALWGGLFATVVLTAVAVILFARTR